jgi:hypothetical protein
MGKILSFVRGVDREKSGGRTLCRCTPGFFFLHDVEVEFPQRIHRALDQFILVSLGFYLFDKGVRGWNNRYISVPSLFTVEMPVF